MGKEKILIVEDNLLVSGAVEDILLDEGFDVEVAEDGKTGLDLIMKKRPHAAVIDYMLPGGMSGIDVCKTIKKQKHKRKDELKVD